MPADVGYNLEIASDPNSFKIGDLKRGDDRVSTISAPSFKVDLDFEVMLKGGNAESEPMQLKDGSAKKSGGTKY